ncbi:MAG TPA: glycosyltransferase family 4 protein [Dinghuibacter sp.]|uniref:glycosyltransferase family 4 protein n=1 Tax=Dinghuibacter sp. TaxID=2024697 RepID=UPI002BDF4426|nr:glycosyltransferase family 4 protein [Dinghuibacter sp.]HTJ10973.1 glycosyltransferase family 4 protein [Dinghuibacter sp.]
MLTRYRSIGATSRLRFLQYLPFLRDQGFECTVAPLFTDAYVKALYISRPPVTDIVRSYADRVRALLHESYDLVWAEKELLPWLPSWLELALLRRKTPLVVDYDDATFHRYDQYPMTLVRMLLGKKIDHVMKRAEVVVAGNEYLADRARKAGARRVEILPTVVDTDMYGEGKAAGTGVVTIGWIGSPSTARYLFEIEPVIRGFSGRKDVRFVSIGAHDHQVKDLTVENEPWSEETEIDRVKQFDIGIMPVLDQLFERGKCGYKLIQYMACGKPVIASPIGVNRLIVRPGENGFLASDNGEWTAALDALIADPELRIRLGRNGRLDVEERYSLKQAAPRLAGILKSVL